MEPLAIIGATAAAFQLADQGIAITKYLHSNISSLREAAQVTQHRLELVGQIQGVFQAIISHPSLQTHAVANLLQPALQSVSKLQDDLLRINTPSNGSRWKRWSRSFRAVMNSDAIERAFAKLDRETTSLVLCLQTVDSKLLHDLGLDAKALQSQLSKAATEVTAIHNAMPEVLGKLHEIDNKLPPVNTSPPSPPTPVGQALNVPYSRVLNFVGRADVLDEIHGRLTSSSTEPGPRRLVLRGIGGQGKTSIAVEYCRRALMDPYVKILWVDAFTQTSFDRSFAVAYELLRKSENCGLTKTEAKVQFVINSLNDDKYPWLMVIDNLDNPGMFPRVQQCIPTSRNACVLITTRHGYVLDLATSMCCIEVDAMDKTEAARVFVQAAKMEDSDRDEHTSSVLRVVEELSCHALAVSQAGSYIRKSKVPLYMFEDQFNHRKMAILDNNFGLSDYYNDIDGSGLLTSLSVFASWELSFQLLDSSIPAKQLRHAKDLLNILAFAVEDEVSEKSLANFCTVISPWSSKEEMSDGPGGFLGDHLGNWDSIAYGDILAKLSDFGLIQDFFLGAGGYYQAILHPLIKSWLQMRLLSDVALQYRTLIVDIKLHDMRREEKQSGRNESYSAWGEVLVDLILDEEAFAGATEESDRAVLTELETSLAEYRCQPGSEKDPSTLERSINTVADKLTKPTLETNAKKAIPPLEPQSDQHSDWKTQLTNLLLPSIQTNGIHSPPVWTLVATSIIEAMSHPGCKSTQKYRSIASACFTTTTTSQFSPSTIPEYPLLLSDFAKILSRRFGDPCSAIPHKLTALRQLSTTHSTLSLLFISHLRSLASILGDANDLDTSEECYLCALDGYQTLFGPKHTFTLRALYDVATIVQQRTDPSSVSSYLDTYKTILRELEDVEEADDLRDVSWEAKAGCYASMANIYLELGDVQQALEAVRARVDLSRELALYDSGQDAYYGWYRSVVDLAECLRLAGLLEEAESNVCGLIRDIESDYGSDHSLLPVAYSELRLILDQRGKGEGGGGDLEEEVR